MTQAQDAEVLRVLRDDGGTFAESDPGLPAELLLRAYREMRRVRVLDGRLLALQRQGRLGFYGSATGQEAVPVAAALALLPDDWVFPALREQAVMLVRGFPLATFLAQIFGREGDILRGRQMPSHPSARSVHQVSWSSCIATQLPHAVGAAYAMRVRKSRQIALAFLGDGATSHGDFHAALNFAGVWRVPCVFVCQNNHYAISVPADRQTASSTLAIKAVAYGIEGLRVDGNDLVALIAVVARAAGRARDGGGPTFIEAVTYRMGPHSSSDDPSRYRDAAEAAGWAERDPIVRLRRHLVYRGCLTEGADEAIDAAHAEEIAAAIAEVEGAPAPGIASMFDDVYAELPAHLRAQRDELLCARASPRVVG